MQILTVDVGTGTQDIYLFDSRLDVENGLKLILPSPTMIIHRRIQQATHRRQPVLLTGTLMGGGPSQWAAENHLRQGLPVYATPSAALSFNDDLAVVEQLGITLVSEDEAASLHQDTARIEMQDFNLPAIQAALDPFGVSLQNLAAVAVAVFDHGSAPPDVSDRQFRFDYLNDRLHSIPDHYRSPLSAFAFPANGIPSIMTRMQAVAGSYQAHAHLVGEAPLVVMDTAPAAVLGATFDPIVTGQSRQIIANVGNFHTLAFRLGPDGVEGLFEHHTGLLDRPALENLLVRLADSTLQHTEVFNSHGHGALIYQPEPCPLGQGLYDVAVTGPRRSLLRVGSSSGRDSQKGALRHYFAVPFGDMMMSGCFGLLAAAADLLPEFRKTLYESLTEAAGTGTAPWDI